MKGIFVQLISTLILTMPSFFSGFGVAWCSYTIEFLQSEETPLERKITNHQAGLLASLLMLGSFISTPVGGMIADAIGRKRTEILCGLLFVLSWSIVTVAANITQIMIGRFLMGIGNGGHSVVVYMYISEYSHNSIRGTMISMVMFAYSAGIIVSYIFRYFFSFEVINYIILMLCVSYIGLMSFLKETPAYLLSRGQHQEALKSLKFYRGTLKITFDIVEEMSYVWSKRYPNLIQKDSETSNEIFERQKSNENYDEKAKDVEVKPWKTLLSTISMRRAIVMITLHVMLVTFTETMAVQSYAGPLFIQAAPTFASHAYSIVLAISVLLGCGVSSMINNMIGRRGCLLLYRLDHGHQIEEHGLYLDR